MERKTSVDQNLYSRDKEYELDERVISLQSLNPWVAYDSGSRQNMFSSHLGQCLPVKGATDRRTITGTEREFGKYTHMIKFPCDAQIIKVIPRYPKRMGSPQSESPVSTIIYEDLTKGGLSINYLDVTRSHQTYDDFGYDYEIDHGVLSSLSPRSVVEKDTVICRSPSVKSNGDYHYGVQLKTAFMSLPGIIEDGVIFSESACAKMNSYGYGERTISFGRKTMPLNLYGSHADADAMPSDKSSGQSSEGGVPEEIYRAFPNIGEYIRDDGLLFASRKYDPMLAPATMSVHALKHPDPYDRLVYAKAGAKITDIIVNRSSKTKRNLPSGMEHQCEYYYNQLTTYYKSILDTMRTLNREFQGKIDIMPELHRLMVEAERHMEIDRNPKVNSVRKNYPLDEWEVTIKYSYPIKPTVTYKVTDTHGGKGIICHVWPDWKMPVDADGNRAEMIADTDSITKRMNYGRIYEHGISAYCRDIGVYIRKNLTKDNINEMWDLLYGFYEIMCPKMLKYIDEITDKRAHLMDVAMNGVKAWLPTNNPVSYPEVIKKLRDANYPICYGPVKFVGHHGNEVTTKLPVLIGELYVLLLEKTGKDWSSLSSAKLQHFGIPSKISRSDKWSSPGRESPVKILGESEIRLITATTGGNFAADLLDQANSPETHKEVVRNLLTAPDPVNIYRLVDRDKIPLGNSKVQRYIVNTLECGGIKLVKGNKDD